VTHRATRSFWEAYGSLDLEVQEAARKAFLLLKENPRHPGVHFKKTGKVWSARVNLKHRALAMERPYGMLWFWIGSHDAYKRMLG
jgi:hypothetical protein